MSSMMPLVFSTMHLVESARLLSSIEPTFISGSGVWMSPSAKEARRSQMMPIGTFKVLTIFLTM